MSADPLLRVDELRVDFHSRSGVTRAVDGVSFEVTVGETLAIVGESGCGKTVTALSILRLIASPPGRVAANAISFDGVDLLKKTEREMQSMRGNRIAMIFQEPMTSLNPIMQIGKQIAEPLIKHLGLSPAQARTRAIELLDTVHVASPKQRVREYPHQLSGGMRQRVMIAMALACQPALLIADEPTTALDVTIQAQILDLMAQVKARFGTATILITHDLGVVANIAQRVVVMYAGRKVEEGGVIDIFREPLHPYTRGLMSAMPRSYGSYSSSSAHRPRLTDIPGVVPSLRQPIRGCAFAPRCAISIDRCVKESPPLREWAPGHVAACHRVDS